jgi:hypothetical protein
MELTIEELMAIRDGLGKVPLSSALLSAVDKVDVELKQRGYERKMVALPKAKYQKKTQYEYQYIKING